jgi:hypothetical protein
MHHCDDKHVVPLDGVDYGVGKHLRKTSANIAIQNSPSMRSRTDSSNGVFNDFDEAKIEAIFTLSVVGSRRVLFRERHSVKLEPHRRRARRTRAKASSPGIVLTLPLRTSSRRRASAAQRGRKKWSSAGSRLCTRRSASAARSSLGKASASTAICSIFMLEICAQFSIELNVEPPLEGRDETRRNRPFLTFLVPSSSVRAA